MALLILLVLITILCFVIDDHEEITDLRRRIDSPMYGTVIDEGEDALQHTGDIHLNKEEWEAFEHKLNTPNPERARKAEAFIHQFDGVVARQEGAKTVIEIPWLDDDKMTTLLEQRGENI